MHNMTLCKGAGDFYVSHKMAPKINQEEFFLCLEIWDLNKVTGVLDTNVLSWYGVLFTLLYIYICLFFYTQYF